MTIYTEHDLRRAITDPGFPTKDLLRIFKNRGYRDGIMALAIQTQNWDGLVAAARRSMAERGAENGEVPYGEFTVLAMASWRSDGTLYPSTQDLKELMLDGTQEEISMLKQLIKAQEGGISFEQWEERMSRIVLDRCLMFAIHEHTEGRG